MKLKTYILNRRNEEIQEKEKEEELAKKRKLLEEEYLKTKEELEKVQKEISDKNNLLKQFADEKHELFLQLKKVLLDDDNRKRIESEKNEHTLLLNNLNHTSQAQIYISQAPLSNNIGQQAPINSSKYFRNGWYLGTYVLENSPLLVGYPDPQYYYLPAFINNNCGLFKKPKICIDKQHNIFSTFG